MSLENQRLVSNVCRQLYGQNYAIVPGTGIAIKDQDQVFIPPGEIHLDRLEAEDVFTFNVEFDKDGNPDLNKDATSPCHNISAYTNLFLKIFQEFDCGCVIYAQPRSAIVVAEIFEKQFKIKNNQLITQISNGETKEQYPWTHELKVPIVDNPGDQTKLFNKLEKAFTDNPATNAVIVKGNGIVVCGDTWQETKLMFDTFLQLFEISIELRKVTQVPSRVTPSSASNTVSKTNGVKYSAKKDDEISVVLETKKRPVVAKTTFPTKAQTPKQGLVIKPAKLTEQRNRVDDNYKAEALKRKKLALSRLRDRTSDRREERPIRSGVRMNAASFLNNDQNMFSRMNQSMNSMDNMNQPMMNNMGNMDMNSMMMNNAMLNMMNNMQQQSGMFMNDMGGMSQGGGMDLDMRQNGDDYDDRRRESRPLRRGTVTRGRPTRGVARKSFKGSVKTRLGFKSTITVDPTLLNAGNVNEEDY